MAFKHHISFAIDLASRFGCGRFRIMPDIVSKRLCAAICSIRIWADALLSDKSSIEILHRIRFGIYRIIPMSYFYSETNQRSKDWAKRCALLWSATTSRLRITSKISSQFKKKWLVAAQYLQSIKIFLTLELSQYCKSGSSAVARFPQSKHVAASSNCRRLGNVLCVCARPSDQPKLAGARPKELDHWFCSQDLRLSSWIAFASDCQMTCRYSNLDSNVNSAAWPKGWKTNFSSEVPE